MQSIAENNSLMSTLKVLNLSGNPIIGESPMCIQYLCKIMVNTKCLRELYLKSCSIDNHDFRTMNQYFSQYQEPLKDNRVSRHLTIEPLEVLVLADSCYALSPQGVCDLVGILRHCPNLKSLNLAHRNINDHLGSQVNEVTEPLENAFVSNISSTLSLIRMDKMKDISGCFHLLWTSLSTLCNMDSLESLDLSYISGCTLQKLVSAGKRSKVVMRNLTSLDVRYSFFQRNITWRGNRMYHIMSTLLALCPNVRKLNLGGNYMTDKQLKILCRPLSDLSQLRKLDLSGNRLTVKKGCQSLYKVAVTTKKRAQRDIERKVAIFLKYHKEIPRAVVLDIIDFTNGFREWQYGLNEIIMFQNPDITINGLESHRISSLDVVVRCVQYLSA